MVFEAALNLQDRGKKKKEDKRKSKERLISLIFF